MPQIHGCKLVGQRSFQEWRRAGRSRSPGQVGGRWIHLGGSPASGGSEVEGQQSFRAGQAQHLQALLSSTFTARGLIAPVRFIWEAAEGASCSFTAPRLGFSSTRCFAFGQTDGDKESYPYADTPARIRGPTTRFLLLSQRKATLRSPSFGRRTKLRSDCPGKDAGMRLLWSLPRALSAVIRSGGRTPGPPGSILHCPGASAGGTPKAAWRDLFTSVHPTPLRAPDCAEGARGLSPNLVSQTFHPPRLPR